MNLRTTSLLCLGSLLANLAFLVSSSFAQEEPPVALTPKAVADEPESQEQEETSSEEVLSEEGQLDLYSAEALTSFVESLGSGAKLHLAENGYAT